MSKNTCGEAHGARQAKVSRQDLGKVQRELGTAQVGDGAPAIRQSMQRETSKRGLGGEHATHLVGDLLLGASQGGTRH
jgi:hypothetical protein